MLSQPLGHALGYYGVGILIHVRTVGGCSGRSRNRTARGASARIVNSKDGMDASNTNTTTLQCANCNAPKTPSHKLIRCICHGVWYCNAKCQNDNWLAHRTEHRRICEEQGLSREEGEAKDAVEDGKKKKETATTTASTTFFAAPPPPQEEEECAVCLEILPVEGVVVVSFLSVLPFSTSSLPSPSSLDNPCSAQMRRCSARCSTQLSLWHAALQYHKL